jgi:AraC family transcriptional regulator, L-rhamnose operon transcriptional activator RhaR
VPDPFPLGHVAWKNYFQSIRRIVAKFDSNHGNYGIHDHEFIEIAFIAGGTGLHKTVLGDSRLNPGDVFLFRPGAWHGYAQVEQLSLYKCCFDTALLGRELGWMADHPDLGRLLWSIPLSPRQHGMVALHLPSEEFARCCQLLDDLCALAKEPLVSHYGDHLGLLVQILSLLARHLPAKSGKKTAASHRAVASALKAIDDDPAEPWTLVSLAARVHLAPAYFVRLFRAAVGLPPMAYLNRRRLELATNLLRRDNLPIGEVGAMSGWLDANYFSRCFRAHFGMTPSRYRARFMEAKERPRVMATDTPNASSREQFMPG